jgi:scavenger receptor class B protein 1
MYIANNIVIHKIILLPGKAKPKLVEVGPYAYVQNMRKTNITFSKDESEVTYAVKRDYIFSIEYSSGPESDVIVMPNIPLFGAMKKLTE